MRTRTLLGASAVLLAFIPAAPVAALGTLVKLDVDHRVLVAGQQLTATATADAPCGWLVEFHGSRRVAHGRRVRATFSAPAVERVSRFPVRAQCFRADATARTAADAAPGGAAERLRVQAPASVIRTVQVTVLPPGGAVKPPNTSTGPPLPGTGGPGRWLLFAGLSALLAGSLFLRICRR